MIAITGFSVTKAIETQTTKQAALPSKLFLPRSFVLPHFLPTSAAARISQYHEENANDGKRLGEKENT